MFTCTVPVCKADRKGVGLGGGGGGDKITCTVNLYDVMQSCSTAFLRGRRLHFAFNESILRARTVSELCISHYTLLCACTEQLCV